MKLDTLKLKKNTRGIIYYGPFGKQIRRVGYVVPGIYEILSEENFHYYIKGNITVKKSIRIDSSDQFEIKNHKIKIERSDL